MLVVANDLLLSSSHSTGILGSLLAKGYIHPESSLPFLPVSEGGAENPMISKLIDFLHLKVFKIGIRRDLFMSCS